MLKYWMKSEDPKSPKPILSEVIKKRKFENRPGVGLSPEPFDEKKIWKDPGTSRYVKSPAIKTLEELTIKRWFSNKQDLI